MSPNPELSTEAPMAALLHQNILEVFSGFILVSIYCLIFGYYYSDPLVWYWCAGMFLLYALRYLTATICITFKKDNGIHWFAHSLLVIGMFLNGLGWSYLMTSNLMQYGIDSSSTIMAIVFCAIRAISCVGNFYGNPKFTITFLIAIVVPTLGFSVIQYPEESLLVVACCLLLTTSLLFVSFRIHRLVQRTSVERNERDHLYTLYANAKREIEQYRVAVKTNDVKQHELEEELNSANVELNSVQNKAETLASTLADVNPYDNETGLIRAANYKNILKREWDRMRRLELPISALHITIDDYQDYKKTIANGTRVAHLKEISRIFQQTAKRPGDVCARISEDQFVILLPEADTRGASKHAFLINESVTNLQIPHDGHSIHSTLSVSVGCASMIPGNDTNSNSLTERAASAVYEASFQGGNKVISYRSLNNLRLEHWDPAIEGSLTEDALIHKLAVWGYSAEQCHYEPGTYLKDKRATQELIHAVLQGKLRVTLEGESTILTPGDCLFIPKGHVSSAEVVGRKPVVCLEAEHSELILDTLH